MFTIWKFIECATAIDTHEVMASVGASMDMITLCRLTTVIAHIYRDIVMLTISHISIHLFYANFGKYHKNKHWMEMPRCT